MKASRCIALACLMLAASALPAHADGPGRSARAPTPLQALEAANGAARQRPAPGGFEQARQIYAYEAGALYEVYTSPNYVTTILLEPGETISTIAAGDTSRWMVTQADAEAQVEGRTIVLVKPQSAGLRTNIVLITDRRTYLVEAVSQSGAAYSAQLAWTYPEDASPAATPLDAINLNYRVRTIRGRAPIWSPARVFDDGRRTWIEFSPGVASSDMPPLFVVTGEGAELVNYRVLEGPSGPRYQVDRIFEIGELRLGTRNPIIVRIERNPVDRRRAERGRR